MNYGRPCSRHAYKRQNCIPCQLSLSERAELLKVRNRGRSDSDRSGDVPVLRDGVVYVRPLSIDDVLDYVERSSEGDVW